MTILISNGRPVITDKTTLAELQEIGAATLSDIPVQELLEFIRNTCLGVSSDQEADDETGWGENFAEAAVHIQAAIDVVDRAIPRATG